MSARRDVENVLGLLFDGLHHGDTDVLGRVFHPGAVYVTGTEGGGEGELLRLTMDEYFRVVSRREPPVERGEARRDRIVSVEFAGPVTALARVESSMGGKRYRDFLTLVRAEGRWQIVSKVFHFETVEGED
ncbi:nuclear transport factor 2 family protein [Streptomyces sp. NPDC059175]|uniref:nuclear transport factor 2 family protein n=1 Tax=Streptomyces sp. NPDC059175 TaxID=3346757 RepID=UPI003690FA6A